MALLSVKEVYCRRIWLLPKRTWGITLYPFIFYNCKHWKIKPFMRRHEWIHVRQIQKDGFFFFYCSYVWQWLTVGYAEIDYEKEAYNNQHNESFSPWE